MATQTKAMGGFGNDVHFEVDYDDARLLLTALRCINNSTEAAWGMATLTENGRSYDMRFPPSQTTVISIPTGQAQRLPITIDANGRLDGVEYHFMWPYP